MKPTRRTFLRLAGTLIALGTVTPVLTSRAEVPSGPSSLAAPGAVADSSGWSVRLQTLGWSTIVADVRSVSFDPIAATHSSVPAAMRKRLQGRAAITEQPIPDGPGCDLPDFTLTFVQQGAGSPLLQLDLGCLVDSPIMVIPGVRAAATKAWSATGMAYEEWLCRTLFGSYMDEFPMYFDPGYLRMLTSSERGVDGRESNACAISLCRLVPGNVAEAVRGAIDDVSETLLLKGCLPDLYFMTYHGSAFDDGFGEAHLKACAHIGEGVSAVMGHDWDESLSPPFLSVIGRGMR